MYSNYKLTLKTDKESVKNTEVEIFFTATLTDNGVPVSGALLGTDISYIADSPIVTDRNGVAKFVARIGQGRGTWTIGEFKKSVFLVQRVGVDGSTLVKIKS